MSEAFLILIACQLIGEAVRVGLSLPIPGPVVGMFLLAAALALFDHHRPGVPDAAKADRSLQRMAEMFISNMGLLFVPAGVGIISQISVLQKEWLPIIAALIGSTILSTVVTGLVMHWLVRHAEHRHLNVEANIPGRPE